MKYASQVQSPSFYRQKELQGCHAAHPREEHYLGERGSQTQSSVLLDHADRFMQSHLGQGKQMFNSIRNDIRDLINITSNSDTVRASTLNCQHEALFSCIGALSTQLCANRASSGRGKGSLGTLSGPIEQVWKQGRRWLLTVSLEVSNAAPNSCSGGRLFN